MCALLRTLWITLHASALWAPSVVCGLDLTWTQFSDSAELPMSSNWRAQMRQQLQALDADELSPKLKMERKKLLRRLGSEEIEPVASDSWTGPFLVFAILVCVGVVVYFYLSSSASTSAKAKNGLDRSTLAALAARPKSEAQMPTDAHKATASEVAIKLAALYDELEIETLEELGEEFVPVGKHQGHTLQEVLQDEAFIKWLRKEPRRGWMDMVVTYADAVEAEAQTEKSLSQQKLSASRLPAKNDAIYTELSSAASVKVETGACLSSRRTAARSA